jgi:hypothetical protein
MMFNGLYKLENEVEASSSDTHVFVGAAKNGRKGEIVIANATNEDIKLSLDLSGFETTEVQMLRIDEINRYTMTGESLTSPISLPACGCIEIKLFDLN